MGTMLSNVIAVGSAGFIASKVFKCLGKNEFSELIMLCGWIGMGISLFTWLNGISFEITNSWFGNFIKWCASFAN
jgi:H+/gluconate symporter-like permease